jgi:predicted GIY-YIG superfamily endonuclease
VTVYLIHFEQPFRHAKHYLGFTSLALEERVARHMTDRGAALLRALNRAGIGWRVVRTWSGGIELEKQLKRSKNAPRLCPVCAAH